MTDERLLTAEEKQKIFPQYGNQALSQLSKDIDEIAKAQLAKVDKVCPDCRGEKYISKPDYFGEILEEPCPTCQGEVSSPDIESEFAQGKHRQINPFNKGV